MDKNLKNILNAAESAARCQRNWDHTKKINQEDYQTLLEVLINSPTKQNEELYSITMINDLDLIREIFECTRHPEIDNDFYKNSQCLANLLVLFSGEMPSELRNVENRPSESLITQRLLGIGVASGQLVLAANQIGLKSGFCHCFDRSKVQNLTRASDPQLIFGVGYPDESKSRIEHHEQNYFYDSYKKPITITEITKGSEVVYKEPLEGDYVVDLECYDKENTSHDVRNIVQYLLKENDLLLFANQVRKSKLQNNIQEINSRVSYYSHNQRNIDSFVSDITSSDIWNKIQNILKKHEKQLFFVKKGL